MLEDLLRAEAQALHRTYDNHDTDDFMRRLAVRIAQNAARPPRVTRALIAPTFQSSRVPPPAAAPAPSHPGGTRPRTRRGMRRRPTPILSPDPAASPMAVVDHVRRLCDLVLRSNDIDSLADFAADYDPRGARTFACLLYTLDRRESALYWWRFAAGGEDPLAAHLLAAHHAAIGISPDARLWRAQARMLGFTRDRHLPQPVRSSTHLAEGFARAVPWGTELSTFIKTARLPSELATR
ncbi:hypothetical protein [Streptomyces sp. V3I7]|uniref:hypothetical protein n=1 Tax=Streptomyces sp. V3I7 TaxID=3042278 RepID=UPI0027896583|nr:hypothetical protein [Streptomyces sp. V3I7]MDQ0994717.1 hypothetical protein [Streptomyces sp. V3I7]